MSKTVTLAELFQDKKRYLKDEITFSDFCDAMADYIASQFSLKIFGGYETREGIFMEISRALTPDELQKLRSDFNNKGVCMKNNRLFVPWS